MSEPKRTPPPPKRNPGTPLIPREKPKGSTTTLFRERGTAYWKGTPFLLGNPLSDIRNWFSKRKRSARAVFNALVIICDDLDAHELAQFDEISIRGYGKDNGEFHIVHDIHGPVFESSQRNILRFNRGEWTEIVFELAATKTSKEKRAELSKWIPLDE